MLFYTKVFAEKALSKNRTRILTRTLDLRKNPLKNGPVQKTGRQGLKTLPFVPCHIEDNVIKTKSVEELIFVQITFEECMANVCFENGKVGIKTTIANLQLL